MQLYLSWDIHAWEDYLSWQKSKKRIHLKLNGLIKDTLRNPTEGIGMPERLKGDLNIYHSRRIDKEHRLVYRIYPDHIHIIQCKFHY